MRGDMDYSFGFGFEWQSGRHWTKQQTNDHNALSFVHMTQIDPNAVELEIDHINHER